MKYFSATLKSKKKLKLKFSTFLKAMTRELFHTKLKGTAQIGVSNCMQQVQKINQFTTHFKKL